MLEENVQKVLAQIKTGDIVLDVGGWASPFNRANWVMDLGSYDTRGFYVTIGMPKSQGGETEFFTKETWCQRDICDKRPWPFLDKFFDFAICSHTLEDIRDPLYVCSELIRVSKRGYIEVPSRVWESCRGVENKRIAGLSHHRWLIEIKDSHIQFTMKYHSIHSDIEFSFPPAFLKKLSPSQRVSFLFWDNNFTYAETTIHGIDNIYAYLAEFVKERWHCNLYVKIKRWAKKELYLKCLTPIKFLYKKF